MVKAQEEPDGESRRRANEQIRKFPGDTPQLFLIIVEDYSRYGPYTPPAFSVIYTHYSILCHSLVISTADEYHRTGPIYCVPIPPPFDSLCVRLSWVGVGYGGWDFRLYS